jgi:integrase
MPDLPKRVLTDPFIRSLKPAPKGERYAVADTLVPGLKVRVSDTGLKTYILWKRWSGAKNPSARTLGKVADMTLAEAREKARQWLELRANGQDPKGRKPAGNTFGDLVEEYLARCVAGQRRGKKKEYEMRRYLLPRWQDKTATEISRADVMQMIDEMMDRGIVRQVRIVCEHGIACYNWAIERGIHGIASSPFDRVRLSKVIGPKRHRDRVLTEDELRALWNATGQMRYPWGDLYRLALLTGARRSELAGMGWSEIDLRAGVWTVPPERFKMNATHSVPLCDDALAILRGVQRWEGSDLVFSASAGRAPVNTFNKAAATLRKLMAADLGTEPDFTLHDLRRSFRTGLAGVGVKFEVAERLIGHAPQGLARIYDQHAYRREMREGTERWARRLRGIVNPRDEKVVPLRSA